MDTHNFNGFTEYNDIRYTVGLKTLTKTHTVVYRTKNTHFLQVFGKFALTHQVRQRERTSGDSQVAPCELRKRPVPLTFSTGALGSNHNLLLCVFRTPSAVAIV